MMAATAPAGLNEPPLERMASLRDWSRGPTDGMRLSGRVAVVSPHLDDAVLSIGAAIAAATRRDADITIVTPLAGDVDSQVRAGYWDARAGFRTAGEAACKRRLEDERACRILGARWAWLPYNDKQYERGGTDDEIFDALVELLGDAETVLVPGRPLIHVDHAWLHELVERRGLPDRTVLYYIEQPYAAQSPEPLPNGDLYVLFARLRDRLTKVRASRAYPSQIRLLGERCLLDTARYEARRGGETILKRESDLP